MMQKKILCFDFDGTLADTMYFVKLAMVKTCQDFGHSEINMENIEDYFGPTEPGIIAQVVGKEEFPAALPYFYRVYIDCQNTLLQKNERILKMLRDIKTRSDVHLVLVTGRSKETLEITLDYLGMNDFFEAYYTGSPTGVNKDVSMSHVRKDFSCDKEDMLYIGDTLSDVEVMKQEGYDILSVAYFHDPDCTKALEEKNPGNVYCNIDSLEEKLFTLI